MNFTNKFNTVRKITKYISTLLVKFEYEESLNTDEFNFIIQKIEENKLRKSNQNIRILGNNIGMNFMHLVDFNKRLQILRKRKLAVSVFRKI